MLGRAPALALSDTLAQRGFDLLPESVIAERVMVGKTFADVTGTLEVFDNSTGKRQFALNNPCMVIDPNDYNRHQLVTGESSSADPPVFLSNSALFSVDGNARRFPP